MKLSDAASSYIDKKRSAGAPFVSGAVTLQALVRFCGDLDAHLLSADRVSSFISATQCSPVTRISKFSAVKGFVAHLQGAGMLEPFELNPPPKPRSYRLPFIFSHDEIRKLLHGALIPQPHIFNLSGRVLRMTLLLLYATGASLQEVLRLQVQDVDLNKREIVMRRLQARRILPIGGVLVASISEHVETLPTGLNCNHLLTSMSGKAVSPQDLSKRFKQLRELVGLTGEKGCSPRIQDLRCTFAVHRLKTWASGGSNLDNYLPALSTYMGYASLSASEQFLSYVPDRFCHDLHKLSPNDAVAPLVQSATH